MCTNGKKDNITLIQSLKLFLCKDKNSHWSIWCKKQTPSRLINRKQLSLYGYFTLPIYCLTFNHLCLQSANVESQRYWWLKWDACTLLWMAEPLQSRITWAQIRAMKRFLWIDVLSDLGILWAEQREDFRSCLEIRYGEKRNQIDDKNVIK